MAELIESYCQGGEGLCAGVDVIDAEFGDEPIVFDGGDGGVASCFWLAIFQLEPRLGTHR